MDSLTSPRRKGNSAQHLTAEEIGAIVDAKSSYAAVLLTGSAILVLILSGTMVSILAPDQSDRVWNVMEKIIAGLTGIFGVLAGRRGWRPPASRMQTAAQPPVEVMHSQGK